MLLVFYLHLTVTHATISPATPTNSVTPMMPITTPMMRDRFTSDSVAEVCKLLTSMSPKVTQLLCCKIIASYYKYVCRFYAYQQNCHNNSSSIMTLIEQCGEVDILSIMHTIVLH